MQASESVAIIFLACWLEYHSDIPAAAAYCARIYAERLQRAREFGIRFRNHWYNTKGRDRLLELSCRASPFLERIQREQAEVDAYIAEPGCFNHISIPWPLKPACFVTSMGDGS